MQATRLVRPCVQGLPDTLSGGDLTSLHQLQPHQQPQHQQPRQQQLPTQFYGSGIYSGAAEYHPGAKAAFQAAPPAAQYDAPQMPGAQPYVCKCLSRALRLRQHRSSKLALSALEDEFHRHIPNHPTVRAAAINFMNNSSLGMDGASEPFASASSQPLQQPQEDSLPKAPATPQQPQAPQQPQQQPGQGAQPQQQPPAGGFARPQQQGSGALNASDAEVPAPGRGRGGDR
jgi:hypothetical protein